MNPRPGLIERAAALLKEGSNDAAAQPGSFEPSVRVQTNGAREPEPPMLTHTLDRMMLAEAGIVMPWSTTQRVVEEFRIIKRHVMWHWQKPGDPFVANAPRTVMVTSAKPREGKTFTAINLALAFAADEGLTTILVDADSARGEAAKYLRVSPRPGITAVLAGEVGLREALVQTDLPNLLVLPPGDHGPHVPEMIAGRGPSLIFAELARRYPEHVIVIDTAPTLASTEPAGLAPCVSQIVFVVEAAHTQRQEIESGMNLLHGCPQIRFILNKAPTSSEHFGGYSYSYGYGNRSDKVPVD